MHFRVSSKGSAKQEIKVKASAFWIHPVYIVSIVWFASQ